MQIHSGRFKGQRIKTVKNFPYRPTQSIVRKSLFDIIEPLNCKNFLDLFSGTGIIGFEAASRGAKSITFVENHYHTFSLIKKNAELLSGPQYKFYQKDVFSFLDGERSYDLIFADPPYSKYDIESLAETILKHLNKNGKFINIESRVIFKKR